MDRRSFLGVIGAAGTVGLAGCASGRDGTATASATATRTRTPTPTPTAMRAEPTPTSTSGGGVAQVVAVGADGLRFTPEAFEIAVGEAVQWEWHASGHNIVTETVPDGAAWRGTPGGPDDRYDAGYVHRAWFDVPGEYAYYCVPHRSAGMTGSFSVVE